MQLQKEWIGNLQTKATKHNKKNVKVDMKAKDMFRKMIAVTMTQLSKEDKYPQVLVREGIKRHSQKAIEAVLAKFIQLYDRQVFRPVMPNELSTEKKRAALNLMSMVKEKRNGKVIGHACADGHKQRLYINKDGVSSPTVQLESLMLTLLVDAHEKRNVATADIVGAYLMAPIDDFILIKLTKESLDIMCQVNTDLPKYVTKEHGSDTLYQQLSKVLYGCMQSALLWYQVFKGCLSYLGFILNPYDPCIANKIINGKQRRVVGTLVTPKSLMMMIKL